MTKAKKEDANDNPYQIKVWGNIIRFKSFSQMLLVCMIVWVFAEKYVNAYFGIDEKEKVSNINSKQFNTICSTVKDSLRIDFVDADTYKETLSRFYASRTKDYAKIQESITTLMMEQEARIKKNIKDEMNKSLVTAKLEFIDIVKQLLDEKIPSIANSDTSIVNSNIVNLN